MKPCPFCAEEIQDAAIKCRYCGSLLEQPSGMVPASDTVIVPRGGLFSALPTLMGITGSLVLFVGVFAPIVSVPIIGSQNFFQNGRGDGVVLLILAGLSLSLTLVRRFRALWLTGFVALGLLLSTFVNFQLRFSEMKSKVSADLSDNPFKGLADAAVQSVQLQWGWAVLVVGSGLLIGAAALSPTNLTPRLKIACAVGVGLIILATAVEYVTGGYLTYLVSTLIGDLSS